MVHLITMKWWNNTSLLHIHAYSEKTILKHDFLSDVQWLAEGTIKSDYLVPARLTQAHLFEFERFCRARRTR